MYTVFGDPLDKMSARLLVGKPHPVSNTTLIQDLISSFLKNADKPVLENVASNTHYTYRDLHEKASSVSRELNNLGLKDGDIVTIASPSTAEALIFMIGTWLSGAGASVINPLHPIDEILYFLQTTRSKVIFTGEGFEEKMQDAAKGLDYSVHIVSPNAKAPFINLFDWTKNIKLVTHVEQPLGQDHMVSIYFTSGTTGLPKAVVIRDQGLKLAGTVLIDIIVGERVLISGPPFWISFPMTLVGSLFKGVCLIQLNAPTPEQTLQTITTYKPTFWFVGVSVLLDLCKFDDLDKYDTSSLLRVLPTGSALVAEQKKIIYQKLFGNRNILRAIYGTTETLLISVEKKEYPVNKLTVTTIGEVLDGVTVKVIDPTTGNILGPNCPGELCVKSVAVLKRYLSRELTDEELDKDGFWHLGDIGFYDEEGVLYYQSRLKELLKYRGYQIAPAELEVVIQTHPAILESVVVGKPSPECGDLPTAFVVLKPGATLAENELSDYVAGKVMDYKKLRGGVYILSSLPKSVTGKVLRRDLLKIINTD